MSDSPVSIHKTYLPNSDVHVGRVSYRIGGRAFWLLDENGDRDLIKVYEEDLRKQRSMRDIETELVSTARSLIMFMFQN
jgi:hypothetical protein